MGTRFEPTFNPLVAAATSAHSSSTTFTVQRVNEWHHFQNSTRLPPMAGLDKFQESLNKMLHRGELDSIRTTMQLHEDVFKNQVKELHRLYSVQKMLMAELRREMASSGTNHLQFNNRENSTLQISGGGLTFNLQTLRDDPSSRERSTGSCSGDNMRIMSRGFDLERPAAAEDHDMSTGVSTIDEDQPEAGPSTPIIAKGIEDSDVELTLSIGGSLSKNKNRKRSKSYSPLAQKSREIESSLSFKSERGGGGEFSDPTTPMSSSSATFDQETKRPHWLFQSLKL